MIQIKSTNKAQQTNYINKTRKCKTILIQKYSEKYWSRYRYRILHGTVTFFRNAMKRYK